MLHALSVVRYIFKAWEMFIPLLNVLVGIRKSQYKLPLMNTGQCFGTLELHYVTKFLRVGYIFMVAGSANYG